jgi:hypothetical protein
MALREVAPLLKLDWRWGFVATTLAPVRGGGEFAVGREQTKLPVLGRWQAQNKNKNVNNSSIIETTCLLREFLFGFGNKIV